MNEHPIEGLMNTAMNSIQNMVDVDTIIGQPIETSNNMVIIPISKVCFGFAAGGSEFKGETINEYRKKDKEEEAQYRLPFGGGSGAGVSISPVAFVVVSQDTVKIMPVDHTSAIDKLIDYVPDLMQKANSILNKTMDIKKEEKDKQKEDVNKIVNQENVKEVKIKKDKDGKIETAIEYDETKKTEQYLEDE